MKQPERPSPRGEELLSYLTGLAPVGNTIEVPRQQVIDDLALNTFETFYKFVNQLISRGYIRRIACGNRGSTGVLVVLRRLEDA